MKASARYFRIVLATCVALLFLVGACTTTRTWEIDTSTARDFQWSGKIRTTEQTTREFGPLLIFQTHTAAHSFELIGRDGRNIVVRPSGHAAAEHPIGRLESPSGMGGSVEQMFAMSLVKACCDHPKTVPSSQPSSADQSDDAQRAGDDLVRLIAAAEHLREGRFDQLSAAEAVTVADSVSNGNYTVFDLGDGKSLKAWMDNASPPSLFATVYDRDGKVLHEYRPVVLEVHEIPAPSPGK